MAQQATLKTGKTPPLSRCSEASDSCTVLLTPSNHHQRRYRTTSKYCKRPVIVMLHPKISQYPVHPLCHTSSSPLNNGSSPLLTLVMVLYLTTGCSCSTNKFWLGQIWAWQKVVYTAGSSESSTTPKSIAFDMTIWDSHYPPPSVPLTPDYCSHNTWPSIFSPYL